MSKNLKIITYDKVNLIKDSFLGSKKLLKQTLFYTFLKSSNNMTNTNVWVFKKIKKQTIATPLPLIMRFARVATVSVESSKRILHQILSDLVNNFSFNTLYFFFKKLF